MDCICLFLEFLLDQSDDFGEFVWLEEKRRKTHELKELEFCVMDTFGALRISSVALERSYA